MPWQLRAICQNSVFVHLYTDLELHWHSGMHKIINFSIYIGFPEYRIRWGGLYLPYKGLWRETSSVEFFKLIYFPQNSSSLLVFLQHTVKFSQRCCFIFSPGNTILQANKYNWQFLNILSKALSHFKSSFLIPFLILHSLLHADTLQALSNVSFVVL